MIVINFFYYTLIKLRFLCKHHLLGFYRSWEFVHPKFIRDRKDLLEDIRRKSPGTKQKKEESTSSATDVGTKSTDTMSQSSINEMRRIASNLQMQIDQLKKSRLDLENNIDALKQTDKRIVDEMSNFNKSLEDKDVVVKEFLNVVSMNTTVWVVDELQANTIAIVLTKLKRKREVYNELFSIKERH
ncbi:hypothetical protein K501DRAFT_270892 [Backusella circina FSU 941]|nr:hypothetical protein K501DRAFT_270892 [Backusella circina FSU 941]